MTAKRTPPVRVPIGRSVTWLAALAALGVVVALPIDVRRPFDRELPEGRDAGAFAYAGWAITNGQVPYRDYWDHKPPGIHYVNALGLTLADGAFAGVRYVETAFVIAALLATWLLAARAFGIVPAALGAIWMAIFTSHPLLLETENMTEVWSSLLAAVAFGMLLASNKRPIVAVASGVLVGAAFLFKPVSLAGALGCGALCVMSAGGKRHALRSVCCLAGGWTVVVAGVCVYLVGLGAGKAFWAQVVDFNFIYVGERADLPFDEHLGRLVSRTATLHAAIGVAVAVVAWAVLAPFTRRDNALPAERGAAIAAGIWLALAIFAAAAPGNYYGHYFLELIPPIGMLLIVGARSLLWGCRRRVRGGVAAVGLVALVATGALQYRQFFRPDLHERYLKRHDFVAAAVSDLRRRDVPPGKFLVWGADPAVYFVLESPSPTRLEYYYPLVRPEYAKKHALVETLIHELESNPPEYIVDFSPFIQRSELAIQPSDPLTHEAIQRRSHLDLFFDWVAERYTPVADPPPFGHEARVIPVYERTEAEKSPAVDAAP